MTAQDKGKNSTTSEKTENLSGIRIAFTKESQPVVLYARVDFFAVTQVPLQHDQRQSFLPAGDN
jgi:hypothetical protein